MYHMYKRPRPTRNMIILRTQAVGTPCPVVGCGVSLTPSGCTTTSCKVADSAATVEHILPLRLGGKHRLYNVTIICHACNQARNSLLIRHLSNPFFCHHYWTISLMESMEEILRIYYWEFHDEFLAIKAEAKQA